MRGWFPQLLLLVVAERAWGACPYTNLATTKASILVADGLCTETNVCGVSSNCTVFKSFSSNSRSYVGWDALGNLSRYTQSSLYVDAAIIRQLICVSRLIANSSMPLTLRKMQLPSTLLSLYVLLHSQLHHAPLNRTFENVATIDIDVVQTNQWGSLLQLYEPAASLQMCHVS